MRKKLFAELLRDRDPGLRSARNPHVRLYIPVSARWAPPADGRSLILQTASKWLPAALPALIAGLFASQAVAAELNVKFEIPRLNVAEYHRPYVAVWIENLDQSVAANLAVLYDLRSKGAEGVGTKWLKDLRQWWRKSGRDVQLPLDGVSGATKPAGEHALSFVDGKAPLSKLPAGEYRLVVEAARESGGRELVKLPFSWPAKKAQSLQLAGATELGAINLDLKP